MSQITTLFLDIGGVLLTNGWDRASRKLAAITFQINFAELEERHHLTFDTYESGKIDLAEYLRRVVFYQPRTFTRNQFRQFMFSQSQPYPKMIELVCKLKENYPLKIAVVSNESYELNAYRIKKFQLNRFVDFYISSCYLHLRKPDPEIYQVALNVAQTPSQQVIYIEDRWLFVDVASRMGIHSILHTGYHSTRKKLAQRGLII